MSRAVLLHPAALRTALLLGLVGLVEVLCRSGAVSRRTLLPPSDMASELWKLLQSGKATADIAQTLGCVAAALAIALVAGFLAGLFLHGRPVLRRAIDPLLATYYAVPFFVFYPVLVAIFGLTLVPIVAIGFAFAVVAVVINTLNGLDRVPRVLAKVAQAHRLPPWRAALKLRLPAAAPYLFAGMKLAVAYSFIGVIASEFILAPSGLGYRIGYAYNNFDNRTMYALMLLVLVLVVSVNMALHAWEKRLLARRRGR